MVATAAQPRSAARSVYETVYRGQPDELAFVVERVTGAIPAELRGTLLRNGPGIMQLGDDHVNHYDALATVSGVGFENGSAFLRSRHVRTPLFEKETRANRVLGRRVFTQAPGWAKNFLGLKLADPASHDVYCWGGRIYATGQTGHFALDPASFDTLGRETWGGKGMQQLGLMTRVDPRRGRLIAYLQKPALRSGDTLSFLEIDGERKVVSRVDAKVKYSPSLVHDVAFTDRFYVVVENASRLRLGSLLGGRRVPYECFEREASPEVVLVPRAGGAPIRLPVPSDAHTIFHIINAFDDGEQVVVDVPALKGAYNFASAAPPELRARDQWTPELSEVAIVRYRIDPARGTLEAQTIAGADGEQPAVHPSRHGQPYRYAWLRAPAYHGDEPFPGELLHFHGVRKLDLERASSQVWSAGPTRFCGPPAFAPRPGARDEDDGWLLLWVVDGETARTEVVILDARELSRPPIATLQLGAYIPLPGHVAWDEQLAIF